MMKIFGFTFFLHFYCHIISSFGSSETEYVFANAGDHATFKCYDTVLANAYENFYVDFKFKSSSPNSEEINLASYRPFSNTTNGVKGNYEGRLRFFQGKVQLLRTTLADEGKYTCVGNEFDLPEDPEFISHLTIYILPSIVVNKLADPLAADSGPTNVAECLASGGKPEADVAWRSVRNFQFQQEPSVDNSSSDGLTNVASVLSFEPSRFYNGEEFQCEVRHPAFAQNVVKSLVVDVTYAPVSIQITSDKNNQLLTCHADGNPTVSYSWSLPGNKKSENATVAMTSTTDPSHQNDTYICTASNSIGHVTANITTYDATRVVELYDQVNVGAIVGAVIGALALIAIVLALVYFFHFKRFRQKDKGPYQEPRSRLLHQSTERHTKPAIQHQNDSLNKDRPPSPSKPPPADDRLDHEDDNTSSSDSEGNHDVDLNSQYVEPSPYDDPPAEVEITSRSSMNFRARRSRPGTANSRRSRTESQLLRQSQDSNPMSNVHYEIPPADDDYPVESEKALYARDAGDYDRRPYDDETHPYHQQPQYVSYPESQQPTRAPRSQGHSQYEPKYAQLDHSAYKKGSSGRRPKHEEPVEYAQIRNRDDLPIIHGDSQLV